MIRGGGHRVCLAASVETRWPFISPELHTCSSRERESRSLLLHTGIHFPRIKYCGQEGGALWNGKRTFVKATGAGPEDAYRRYYCPLQDGAPVFSASLPSILCILLLFLYHLSFSSVVHFCKVNLVIIFDMTKLRALGVGGKAGRKSISLTK